VQQPAEVIEWLDSRDGQKWLNAHHQPILHQISMFASVKEDAEEWSNPWRYKQALVVPHPEQPLDDQNWQYWWQYHGPL